MTPPGVIVAAHAGWMAIVDYTPRGECHLQDIIAWRVEVTWCVGKKDAIYLNHPITVDGARDDEIVAIIKPDGSVDDRCVAWYPCLDSFLEAGRGEPAHPYQWDSERVHPNAMAACVRWGNERGKREIP